MPLQVTLHRPDATDVWRVQLRADPASHLPREVFVALDGRPSPFHAPPPTSPRHPINLLWTGATGHAAAILAAVRAGAAGALSQDHAEAIIAAQFTDWARGWTYARAWFARRGVHPNP